MDFFAGGGKVSGEAFGECAGGVEAFEFAGDGEFVADVVEVDRLAVGRVEEGGAEAAEVESGVVDAFGVTLGLREDALRADGEFFGFDDAEEVAIYEESVVGGAVGGGEFFNGVGGECGGFLVFAEGGDGPAGCPERNVDELLARLTFGVGWVSH